MKKRSRALDWIETDGTEIQVYHVPLLLQGLVYKPEIQYFTKKGMLKNTSFEQVMTKTNFFCYLSFCISVTIVIADESVPKKLLTSG